MDHRRGRIGIIIVLLVGLVLATIMRQVAANHRGTAQLAAATPLSRMNSYALALLLGGLRGPLVMFLWPSAEGQKTEKNLEDFDTKVEWIRLLQAEFDTVHLFQIWNKAYNISVLMANLANKYATILDALDYAHHVDAERPNNINILSAIAGVYGEKLGSSAEKSYYKSRVREETRAREPLVRITFPSPRRDEFTGVATRAGASPANLTFVAADDAADAADAVSVTVRKSLADAIEREFRGEGVTYAERPRARVDRNAPGFRRTQLDPMLDASGNVLPELLRPRPGRAVGGNDGSELQYLATFEPYPYGIGAHAMDYNYRKRAQMLLRNANQHHAQLADLVVDSRPALSLRAWAEDEWERGRRAEMEALGVAVPNERAPLEPQQRLEMEGATQGVQPTATIASPRALDEAIFSYERAVAVAVESLAEYDVHLDGYRTNFGTYLSHKEHLQGLIELLRADAAFVKLLKARDDDDARDDAGARTALAREALERYRGAIVEYQRLLLARYLEDRQLQEYFPRGVTRDDVHQLPPEQVAQLAERVRNDILRLGSAASAHWEEWTEYYTYIARAEARLRTLQPATAAR